MKLGKEFLLNNLTLMKKFVNIANKYPNEISVGIGRYVVNAKSILGLFSLDLEKPVTVWVDADTPKESINIVEELFVTVYDIERREWDWWR